MSKCQDLEPLFAQYVDGEAVSHDRAALEAHLDRCPPCRERLDAERAVHQVLVARRSELRGCASADLRAKCAAYARHGSRPSFFGGAAGTARKWLPLSLAATLLLAVAGAFFYGLNDTVEALAAQLTLDHVRCFQFAPERLEHADSAAAGRAWTSAHGWALQVPPSSAGRQLELLGVRRCLMSTGGVAHVMYKWRGEPLSVFVVPRTIRQAGELHEIGESFGHEALIWADGGRTYVVVARGRPADLEAVAGYVKASAH
jgi:anti-sigma factor RsiW